MVKTKNMFRRIFLFIILTSYCILGYSQIKPVQWTGIVRNEDLLPLPFASIGVERTGRGTLSDKDGLFTIVMYPTDSLTVAYMGYKTLKLPIPKNSPDVIMYDIIMESDTITLSEVLVLPWNTYKDFVDDFVHTTLATDEMQRAYKNLQIISKQVDRRLAEDYNQASDPYFSYRLSMLIQQQEMQSKGEIIPTYRITDPLAWAQLVEAIKRGDFKKQE